MSRIALPWRRLALAGIWTVWALVAAGCAGAPADLPEDRFYRLPEPAPVAAKTGHAGTIAVTLPHSDGLHTERALLYSRHDRPLEILRHHYFFWAESPPRLLQDYLIQHLRGAGLADRVLRAEAAPTDALRLESRLLRFERRIGGAETQVLVELELGWSNRADRSRRPYRALVTAADDSIYASVQAYGHALGEILDRFLREHPPS